MQDNWNGEAESERRRHAVLIIILAMVFIVFAAIFMSLGQRAGGADGAGIALFTLLALFGVPTVLISLLLKVRDWVEAPRRNPQPPRIRE